MTKQEIRAFIATRMASTEQLLFFCCMADIVIKPWYTLGEFLKSLLSCAAQSASYRSVPFLVSFMFTLFI